MIPTIITQRLHLKRPGLKDAWLMYKTFKISGFTDGMYYEGPVSLWFALKSILSPKGIRFSIRIKNMPIGSIWLLQRKTDWHLGYWLHPDQQGKGYMHEAAEAIIEFSKQTLQADRLCAAAYSWNQRSINILEKHGFTMIGINGDKREYVVPLR